MLPRKLKLRVVLPRKLKLRQQPGPGPAGSWAGPAWFKMLLGLGGNQGGGGGERGNFFKLKSTLAKIANIFKNTPIFLGIRLFYFLDAQTIGKKNPAYPAS